MKNIFDSTTLKNKQLKNRIFRSATWMSMANEDGHVSQDVVDLYKKYSSNDVGAIITGITSIYEKVKKFMELPVFMMIHTLKRTD